MTQPTGVFESNYRASYADKPDKETRDGLTRIREDANTLPKDWANWNAPIQPTFRGNLS